MKKIIFFLIISYSFSNKIFCQIWKLPTINTGLAFRVLPFTKYNDRETNVYGLKDLLWADNRGRFFVDINLKLPGKNNLSISSSNYISFEKIPVFYKFSDSLNSRIDHKSHKRDHFFNIINKFKSKKNKFNFILGIGIGAMNLGTSYTFHSEVYGYDYRTFYTQRVFATNYIFGFEARYLQISLVVHSFGSQNLQIPKVWLEPKFAYMIHSLKKKK